MSSIQRSLNTLQYFTGTQNGVLTIEVSAIQRFAIERFHCIRTFVCHMYIFTYMYVRIITNVCTVCVHMCMCYSLYDGSQDNNNSFTGHISKCTTCVRIYNQLKYVCSHLEKSVMYIRTYLCISIGYFINCYDRIYCE